MAIVQFRILLYQDNLFMTGVHHTTPLSSASNSFPIQRGDIYKISPPPTTLTLFCTTFVAIIETLAFILFFEHG